MATVLFVHGLESGPRGRKARALAEAGFTVVSEQMPCGRAAIARDPVVVAGAGGALVGIVVATAFGGLPGFAGASAALVAASPVAYAGIARRAFRRSVEVQRRSLSRARIDVVVGSSFGGAVALALLHQGLWSGPTLLLCPAHELIAVRARQKPPGLLSGLPEAVSSRILVVHGRGDRTVPLASSRALVAGSRARLLEVEDDHRLAATATAARFAEWIASLMQQPAA